MIDVRSLEKRFDGRTVLRDLTFSVARGEVVGLLGPNGAGKTTTVRLLNGVARADGGELRVAGLDPMQDGDGVRRVAGVLTESAAFYGHLSGRDNLRFFARLTGVREQARVDELLERFGLADAADRAAGTYSTGMKKRLGLARALLHRPQVLFLDEPTNGLDPEGIRLVLESLRQLSRDEGTTMVICSHLLQQLEQVCHRYLFIDGGRIVAQGTLPELESQYLVEAELEVETSMASDRAAALGHRVTSPGPGRLVFTLPARTDVPELLRRLSSEADVYEARVRNRGLEQVYFRIQQEPRRER